MTFALAVVAVIATLLPFGVGVFRADRVWLVVAGVVVAAAAVSVLVPRSRRALHPALVGVTAVMLSLTAADLALRPSGAARVEGLRTEKLPRMPLVERFAPNAALSMHLVGDIGAMTGHPHLYEGRRLVFRSDAFGFRNDRVPDEIDLLVLADSFGVGVVSQDETVAAQLAAQTRRRVYDLSQPRTGPWAQYVNLLVEAPRLRFAREATVLWLLYTGNDLVDEYADVWTADALPWQTGIGQRWVELDNFRARSAVRGVITRVWHFGLESTAVPAQGRVLPNGVPFLVLAGAEHEARRPLASVTAHANWPKLRKTLAQGAAFLARRGVAVTVIVLPTKGEVYRWLLEAREPTPDDSRSSGFAAAVLGACTELRVRCVDAKPALVRESRTRFASAGELLFFRDDTHPNRAGNAVIVDVAISALEAR
ncbi:MAG: hypothetical protein HYU41_17760 [Candidatus Rokubacteria bacterium]|nr:hypothetical protein [Candidatus Rokubacteria bacterium]